MRSQFPLILRRVMKGVLYICAFMGGVLWISAMITDGPVSGTLGVIRFVLQMLIGRWLPPLQM